MPDYLLGEQHRETLERTGFKFGLYDCRHTFATRTLENGQTDLLTLASFLGHSNLNQVQRVTRTRQRKERDGYRFRYGNL